MEPDEEKRQQLNLIQKEITSALQEIGEIESRLQKTKEKATELWLENDKFLDTKG